MQSRTIAVSNKLGVHARPAGLITKTAGLFDCSVILDKKGKRIDAKSILGVLSLDLNQVLTVKYRGKNAEFEDLLNKYQAC